MLKFIHGNKDMPQYLLVMRLKTSIL